MVPRHAIDQKISRAIAIVKPQHPVLILLVCGASLVSSCTTGKESAAPVTLPAAVSVSIAPNVPQSVDQGQSIQFVATVANDSSDKGVSWSLTRNGTLCAPACGTISPADTLSGGAATYTAPAAISATLQFNVTATSVADTSKFVSNPTTDVPPPVLNNPTQLPTATAGQAYSYQLTETGGVAPYTWSVISGSLPNGLKLDSSTGLISGAPMTAAVVAVSKIARALASSQLPPECFDIEVQDSGNPPLVNTEQLCINIVGLGATPSQLVFVQQPLTTSAGDVIIPSPSVAIEDASGNIVVGASNPVTITIGANPSGGTLSTLTTQVPFSGVATFPSLSIDKAGNGYTLVATSPGLTPATSNAFNIAGPATHFVLSAPPSTPVILTRQFNFSVTAEDASNNIVTGYSGTVHFTSSDGQAIKPMDSNLAGGTGTFSATLNTLGNQTITATDTVNMSITGSETIKVQVWFNISAAPTSPMVAAAGTPFTLYITAVDGVGNCICSSFGTSEYTGTVHVASTDPQAIGLPVDYTFTSSDTFATHQFTVTLNSIGIQRITVTDNVTSVMVGSPITVIGLQLSIKSPGNFNMQRSTIANPSSTNTFNSPAILTASGGTPPYTWSALELPDSTFSVSTDASGNGIISTTGAYQIGPFSANVKITDAIGLSWYKNVQLTVGCWLADYSGAGPHNNNAALAGTFAYLFSGFIDPQHPQARVGAFAATSQGEDPNTWLGIVNSGTEDYQSGGPVTIFSAGSMFCIDLDGSGTLVLNNGNLPVTYRIRGALSPLGGGPAQSAQMMEFDGIFRGSAELRLQDPATMFGSGNYVFGFSGRDGQDSPASVAGDFAISALQPPGGPGAVNGEEDFNDAVLFGPFNLGLNIKFSGIQATFTPDAANSKFFRYTGSITATDSSIPTLNFAAYLVPGMTASGVISNKLADLFIVTSGPIGPMGLPGVYAALTGKIHSQNLPQPLGNSMLNGAALYYLEGPVPDPINISNTKGSAATIGYAQFDGKGNETLASQDSDIDGTISSTGTINNAGTYQVSATGRVTGAANGPAFGYVWDANTAVWLDTSANAGLGELSRLTSMIFESQLPNGQLNCMGPSASNAGTALFNIPPAVWQSPTGVGQVFQIALGPNGCPNPPATNFGLKGDIDSLLGLQLGVDTGQAGTLSGLPWQITPSSGGISRFTVGDCPNSSNTGEPCFVGYGYSGLFGQILIETNLGLKDPSGLPLGPNPVPVVIVWK